MTINSKTTDSFYADTMLSEAKKMHKHTTVEAEIRAVRISNKENVISDFELWTKSILHILSCFWMVAITHKWNSLTVWMKYYSEFLNKFIEILPYTTSECGCLVFVYGINRKCPVSLNFYCFVGSLLHFIRSYLNAYFHMLS